jgi:NAD(P)-dependent dehydrogenase (short-subunit alcohol dehydrogenase family)
MEMDSSPGTLREKVALVTGAGAGIGRASALAFAQAGARVVVSDVARDGAEETVRLIRSGGGEATFVAADVSNAGDVEGLIKATVGTYGRLDCAHNNAGVGSGPGQTAEIEEAQWARVIGINLTGVWLCLKHEIPQMLAQGGGAIVNTASVAGLVGGVGSAYVAAKHGVIGLTKNAALEYAARGIRVNAVCPGGTRTRMLDGVLSDPEREATWLSWHPIGRFGMPEEVAAAVVWLCSDAASFVTGIAMPVDGCFVAR